MKVYKNNNQTWLRIKYRVKKSDLVFSTILDMTIYLHDSHSGLVLLAVPSLSLSSAGITGLNHHAQLKHPLCSKTFYLKVISKEFTNLNLDEDGK